MDKSTVVIEMLKALEEIVLLTKTEPNDLELGTKVRALLDKEKFTINIINKDGKN